MSLNVSFPVFFFFLGGGGLILAVEQASLFISISIFNSYVCYVDQMIC